MSFKLNKHILLISAIFCLLILIPSSFASDINQTDTDDVLSADDNIIYVSVDGNDGGNGSQSNPYNSISKAVEQYDSSKNSNIFISDGEYNLTSQIILDRDITIIGESSQGVKLNGQSQVSIIKITNKVNVVLKNLSIINGYSESGGYFSNYASGIHISYANSLFVDNCIFDNNTLSAISYDSSYTSTVVNITNSVFSNNSRILDSQGFGGAIYFYGVGYLNVTNTTFKNNYANSTYVSQYLPNGSMSQGGAIYVGGNAKDVYIDNCKFINNSASQGSAFAEYCGGNTTIINCLFEENVARGYEDHKQTVICDEQINPYYLFFKAKNNTFINNHPSDDIEIEGKIQFIDLEKNDRIDATKTIDMYEGDDKYFEVSLTTDDGNPLSGREITVSFVNYFNQVTDFLVITDSNGKANISLKTLKPGRYTVLSTFNGDSIYDEQNVTSFVNVRAENYINIIFNPDYIQLKEGESYIVNGTVCDYYYEPTRDYNGYDYYVEWIDYKGSRHALTGNHVEGSKILFDINDCSLTTSDTLYYVNFTLKMDSYYYDDAQGTVIVDMSVQMPNVDPDIEIIYVSKDGNDETGDGTEMNPLNTLQMALYVNHAYGGGKTIFVKEGIYEIANYNIFDNVTIIGEKSKTILKQNNGNEGMFKITYKNTVNLYNLTFIDGYTTPMPYSLLTIRYEGTVVNIDGCEFYNCSCLNGAAIAIDGGAKAYVNNSIFANNQAILITSSGGAIRVFTGYLYVANSQFVNNTASDGGAIYSGYSGNMDIINCTFVNNTAIKTTLEVGGGGAIYTSGILTNIDNCTFIENYADLYGGAILLNGGSTYVTQSLFLDNKVGAGEVKGSAIQNNQWTSVELSISHSVLISKETYNNLILISNIDECYVDADSNYWGTNSKYSIRSNIPMNNYAIIKATKDVDPIYTGDSANINIEFVINDASTLDKSLHDFAVSLVPTLGEVHPTDVIIKDNAAKVTYFAIENGTERISFNNVSTVYTYSFVVEDNNVLKNDSNANISINAAEPKSTIDIQVPTDLTGNITVTVNGVDYEIQNNNGHAILNVDTAPGNYDVTIIYKGDDNYKSFYNVTSFSVDKRVSKLDIKVDDISVGDDLVIIANVTKGATGQVVVLLNNKNYTIYLNNSEGSISIFPISAGSYNITATYMGDNYYNASTAKASFNVADVGNVSVIYVDVNGSDETGDGSQENPYATISKALDRNKRIGGNRTIIVNEGEYELNRYSITDNVTVLANGNVVISQSANTNHIYIAGDVDVTLSGLTFINGNGLGAGSIDVGNDGNGNALKNLTIIDCKFINNTGIVGAIVSYANTNICRSSFINNTATTASGANQGIISVRGNELDVSYSVFLNNEFGQGAIIYSTSEGKINDNFFGTNDKPENIPNNLQLDTWAVIIPEIDDDVRTKTNYDLEVSFKSTANGVTFEELGDVMPHITVDLTSVLGKITPQSVEIIDNKASANYIDYIKGSEQIDVSLNGNVISSIKFSIDVPEYDKIYVSVNGSDGNNGSRDAPFATIKQAITQNKNQGGNKTIILMPGTFNEHDLTINDDVIIISDGATVDGENAGSIFNIGANVEIYNLTLTNALSSADGGAINHVSGDLIVANCEFINNTALNGGAIASKSNMLIFNSTFDANGATKMGSAVYSTSNATIEKSEFKNNDGIDATVYSSGILDIADSKFRNNKANDGAAIYIQSGEANIADNEFISNAGNSIIYVSNSDAVIGENEFNANSNDNIIAKSSKLDLYNNTMDVGGITVDDTSLLSNIILTFLDGKTVKVPNGTAVLNATITDDMGNAINGGKIRFTSNGENIGEAVISNGSATLKYDYTTGDYTISGSFSGSSDDYAPLTVDDGLLRVDVKNYWFIGDVGYELIYEAVEAAQLGDVIKGLPGTYIIDNVIEIGHRYMPIEPWESIKSVTITSMDDEPVIFKGTTSRIFYVDNGSELTLTNVVLTDCYAEYRDGGAVETMYDSNITIINCTFMNNTGERGGALFIWGNAVIKDTVFRQNHATSIGGAVFSLSSKNILIDNTTFIENDAVSYAGAIYFSGSYTSDSVINNSQFINNTGLRGGAIFNGYGNVTIDNTDFIENKAINTQDFEVTAIGGAIYTSSSSDTFITNTKFIKNYAEDNGGAADIDSALVIIWTSEDEQEHYYYHWATFDNCTFVENYAGGTAGAIQVGDGHVASVNITNSLFEGNQAFLEGAVIYCADSFLNIANTEFVANKAIGNNNLIFASGDYVFDGASYVEFDAAINIENATFRNNDADFDIYLTNEYAFLDLYDSVFDGDKTIIYNKGNANLVNNKEINVKSDEYAVDNAGTLYLEDNEFINVIYNTGVIESPTYIKVLDNETVIAGVGETFKLTAVIVDDNNNNIEENGSFTFLIDGKEVVGQYDNAQYSADYQITSTTNDVYAKFDGAGLVDLSVLKGTITVKNASKMSIDTNTPTMGEDAIITVTMDSKATGNVTISVNGKSYNVKLNGGVATITVPDLKAGTYKVEVSYPGDESYASSKADANLEVLRLSNYTIDANIPEITEGEDLTVNVNLPEDATGMVSVVVGDNVKYASVKNGVATIIVPGLAEGTYDVTVNYLGNDKYAPSSIKDSVVVKESSKFNIITEDVEKYFTSPERFVVKVVDNENNPLANVTVIITINGVDYTRTTNANGTASMALNIPSGIYNVTTRVNDTIVNNTVTIKATVNGTDLVKVFRNATQYYATFRDSQGNYLPEGTEVEFNINGVFYTRKVTANGMAKLNINLEQGEYIITAINPLTKEMGSNIITVIPRIIENHDLVKYYRNASQYTVKIIGDDGKAVGAGVEVTFNINGVFYTRTTNASGIAKLNINLNAGEYIITAEYNNCKVSNNITVKPILSAEDITMSYRDGTQFEAKLVDGQGNPYRGQSVTFNINGVFYTRTTDADGVARLNINLMSGEYIITSTYNSFNIANKITIA